MNSKSSPLENSKRASSVGATQQDLRPETSGPPLGPGYQWSAHSFLYGCVSVRLGKLSMLPRLSEEQVALNSAFRPHSARSFPGCAPSTTTPPNSLPRSPGSVAVRGVRIEASEA